jgi:hypothetical protein
VADFRSERMPSPDGHGNAKAAWRRAWDAYSAAVGPVLEPAVRPIARTVTFDAMGFWLAWHLEGGFEGMQSRLGMSRSAIYRRLSLFRRATGKHPDDWKLAGVQINVEEYIRERAAADNDQDASPEKLD